MGEPDVNGEANVMAAFAFGLRPILVSADVVAFRQYLGRWDEVLGDTSILAMQSDEEVRRTMTEMLRRPRQFGLPAWVESVGDEVSCIAVDQSPAADTLAVESVDPSATGFDGLTLQDATSERRPQVRVCEAPETWRQSNFVTGTLVEPRGRVPRVMPAGVAESSPRRVSRAPRGFRQLDLPLG
jgi:hypothetical protein